jgi:hypothetical protein
MKTRAFVSITAFLFSGAVSIRLSPVMTIQSFSAHLRVQSKSESLPEGSPGVQVSREARNHIPSPGQLQADEP